MQLPEVAVLILLAATETLPILSILAQESEALTVEVDLAAVPK